MGMNVAQISCVQEYGVSQRAEIRVQIGRGLPIFEDMNDEMRLASYCERIG